MVLDYRTPTLFLKKKKKAPIQGSFKILSHGSVLIVASAFQCYLFRECLYIFREFPETCGLKTMFSVLRVPVLTFPRPTFTCPTVGKRVTAGGILLAGHGARESR